MSLVRFLTLVVAAVYSLLLLDTYSSFGPVAYGTMFRNNQLPFEFAALTVILAVFPTLWLPIRVTRPSQVCVWFLYLLAYVPSMLLPMRSLDTPPSQTLPLIIVFCLGFAALSFPYRLALPALRQIKVQPITFYGTCLAASLGLIVIIIAVNGLRVDLSLASAYTRRAEYKAAAGGGSVLSYASSILANSLVPVLFALAFERRKWWMAILGAVSVVILFSMGGQKSVFFTPILIAALYLILKGNRRHFGLWLCAGATAIVAIAMVERQIFDTPFLSLAFVHRLVFTPGILTGQFWDFFSNHPHIYLSDSILGFLLHSPYDQSAGLIIGELYARDPGRNATTNVFAQGYAHFGYLGMVLAGLALGSLLYLFDAATTRRNFLPCALVMGLLGIFWSNVALHTSMLSNGIIVTLLLLYLLPSARKIRPETNFVG
ncbi:MAG TPA: oligosaccharide repeat unit polymerase [Fimbriimonadaceae bacterium]|nr:oligosaccharide repeat unit polymerase [Fimbriimonadaceae bacterium]